MSNVTFEMIAVSLRHALQWNFKLNLYTTNNAGVWLIFPDPGYNNIPYHVITNTK